MTSPLKWVGGKRWLGERLRALYAPHQHRRFADVFVGGGSAVLGVAPEHALLCDANPHLINFWEQLRDPAPFALEMRNDEALYYAYRTCFNELGQSSARWSRTAAELFYFLNRSCFNGVCRFNSRGIYNVPFGKYKTINYRRDFSEYVSNLSRWAVTHCHFEYAPVDEKDFVYIDPPYDGDKNAFVDYSAGGFDWDMQVRLATKFAAHSGPVVASNAGTDRILALYRSLGYAVETLPAPRSVAASGDRTPVMEMLATRNIAPGGREGTNSSAPR